MAQQCKATAKSTGERCARQSIEGGVVCRVHGGATKAAKEAAARNVALQAAEREVRTLGLPVDISPTDALLEEVRWTAGHVEWLRAKVQELDTQIDAIAYDPDGDDEPELMSRHPNHARHGLVWGTTSIKDKRTDDGGETTTVQGAGASLWYELYAREREHLVKVCAAAIRAGCDERRVRLAERQGDLVGLAIRKILDGMLAALLASGMEADLHTVWATSVSTIVPRELRALAAGTE